MNNCLVAVRRLSAGAVVVAGLLLAGCSTDGPAFTGVDITGASYATSFDLTDHTGQRRTLADFKGQWWCCFLASPSVLMSAQLR